MVSPEFDRPPVAETLLGVQFRPLQKLHTAHLGAFWSTLGAEWADVREVPALGQTIEPVGREATWLDQRLHLELSDHPGLRLQIHKASRDRLLQIENGWFVYNWRRPAQGAEYIRYAEVRREFEGHFEKFRSFVERQELGTIEPNLWEIAYINFIARGALWSSTSEWSKVLPNLFAPGLGENGDPLQTLTGRWAYSLGESLARLQVVVEHARLESQSQEEALVLKLIARGPTREPSLQAMWDGLDLGHGAIVRKFVQLTSPEARSHWGYQQ